MTRTVLPLAAFLSLFGLPAAAAELGDEASGAGLVGDLAASPSADAVSGERAERRGGSKGGKGAAAGARAPSGKSASSARPIQAPASRPAANAPSAERSSARPAPGAARPAATGPSSARPATSSSRPAATSARPASGPSAARSQAPSSSRDLRPSSGAARPDSSSRASAARTTSRGGNEHRSGSQHVQANNGPKAANTRHAPPKSASKAAQHKAAQHKAAAHHAEVKARHKKANHVVHRSSGLPPRWSPAYHRYHIRGVPHHSPRYWASGIFIYNPPPKRHKVVVVDGAGKRVADGAPTRAVDRNNSFALGLRGGSYMSGYMDGGAYGDFGMGLAARYRPVESLGLEVSWMHHSDTWDDHAERAEDPLSASVQLFAFPWTRVSPYALVGVTVTPREADDTYFNGLENVHYEANDALAGPHAGVGIEFALGKSAAIGFEGRYVGYIDRQDGDDAFPGAFQGNMGLNFYF